MKVMGIYTGRVGIGSGMMVVWVEMAASSGEAGWKETEGQRAGAILFLLRAKETGVDKLSETRREREMKEMVNLRSNYYEKVM